MKLGRNQLSAQSLRLTVHLGAGREFEESNACLRNSPEKGILLAQTVFEKRGLIVEDFLLNFCEASKAAAR